MKKATVIFLLVFLFPCFSFAGYVSTGLTKITSVYGGYDDAVFFTTEAVHINPANCSYPTPYKVDSQNADTKSALAVLLTAYVTQDDVEILVFDDACLGTNANIMRIKIVRPE